MQHEPKLSSRGEILCENLFERLAEDDPHRLVKMLLSGEIPDYLLTYAAEEAGNQLESELVVPALLQLLSHPQALVREGAILGLGEHESDEITTRLLEIASMDSSPGVRERAKGALMSPLRRPSLESDI